jgi:hypothetical protein
VKRCGRKRLLAVWGGYGGETGPRDVTRPYFAELVSGAAGGVVAGTAGAGAGDAPVAGAGRLVASEINDIGAPALELVDGGMAAGAEAGAEGPPGGVVAGSPPWDEVPGWVTICWNRELPVLMR